MQTTRREKEHRRQLEVNLRAFSRELPRLLVAHEHQFALLHNAQIVGTFGTAAGAFAKGMDSYGQGQFSIQKIDRTPASLGVHSRLLKERRPLKQR
jgi:hypothetical protein